MYNKEIKKLVNCDYMKLMILRCILDMVKYEKMNILEFMKCDMEIFLVFIIFYYEIYFKVYCYRGI